jgi:hypothetical protein
MYPWWQGMSAVGTRRADKATRNVGDRVARCHKRIATVCDIGLQNSARDAIREERVDFVAAMHEIRQSISDISRIILNSVLLCKFPEYSASPYLTSRAPHFGNYCFRNM